MRRQVPPPRACAQAAGIRRSRCNVAQDRSARKSGTETAAPAEAPAAASAPTPAQLAEELTAVERRALEAEEALARERHASAERIGEMEARLRGLEPWLRKLKQEHERITAERDELLRTADAVTRTKAGASAEVTALGHDLAAARTERDAAVAELVALRKRIKHDQEEMLLAWQRRITSAEAARDAAQAELAEARRTAHVSAGTGEELRGLKAQLEQATAELSAQAAIARTAQEDAERLRRRVRELEDGDEARASEASRRAEESTSARRRITELETELAAAREAATDARSALDAAREESQRLSEMRDDAVRKAAALEARVGSEAEARARAEHRADESGLALAERLAEMERATHELANARSALAALETERDGLARSLEEEREERALCVAAIDSTHRSEFDALRTRQEAELAAQTTRAEDAELRLAAVLSRVEAAEAEVASERRRIRLGVSAVLSDVFQRLVDGMEHVVGPDIGMPPVQKAGDVAVEGASVADGAPDWDQLLSDLEALRTEVEEFRDSELLRDVPGLGDEAHAVAVDDDRDDGTQSMPSEAEPAPAPRRRRR